MTRFRKESGVDSFVSIGTKLSQFDGVRAVAEAYDNVWCSVGIHPHEAEKELLENAAPLLERAQHPKVIGLGETGLDYFYEHSPRAQQAELHAAIAKHFVGTRVQILALSPSPTGVKVQS